ncbi:MAG: hypothetical protein Kow0037_00970 [Calditrichia bacterium]
MSISFGCNCEERRKPVLKRNWVVTMRKYNCSAFNGYKRTPSDYSEVRCLRCGKVGRTKAQYVDQLRNSQ